jgi:outer membrane receptor protein involved in Fe transport
MEAALTGILKGKVLDADGKPVIGASVLVVGTNRGTYVKDANGSFTIVNIDGGTYTVKVTYMGYPPYEMRGVRISADNTTEISVVLQEEKGISLPEVVKYANREMVNANTVGQVRKMDADEIQSISREGISAIIGMTAGVVQSGTNSYSIRGSRSEETTVKVDGISKTNKFSGGGVASGITEFDTEEIQVMTGGMGAEYGGAMGGIVNTIMKRGRTDRYEGYLRYRTDIAPLFGSQATGKKLVYDESRGAYKAVASGEGAKLQGPGQHRVAFGTGGPLPYLDGSTFYLSSNYSYRKFNGASFEIYDPWSNNLGQMPNDQNWNKNIAGRLRFKVMSGVELNLGLDYGSVNDEGSSMAWLYANDEGIVYDQKTFLPKLDANGDYITNGIPERIAKQNVSNQLSSTFFMRLNHTISNSSYYQVTVSYSNIRDEVSRRVGYEDPGYFSGFDLIYPQDQYAIEGSRMLPGSNNIIDFYEIIKKNTASADGYMLSDKTQINPLTGYIEGQGDASGTNNPWGRQQAFYTHGAGGGFSFRESKTFAIDGIFEKSISGEFNHTIRSGFDFYYYNLTRHLNQGPWDGNPFMDVYTDEWNGNLYTSDPAAWAKTSKAYNPFEGSLFVLDQIGYKGIIISPSLRFDLFNPNSDYRTMTTHFVSIKEDTGFAKASMKYQLSPRINIAYPVTERSYFSISYGMYFQMPVLSSMYDGFATVRLRGNQILGDPNMEAQRTNQYEVNYNNQLSDEFVLTVSAYYKDVYNQLGQVYVPAVPTPYFQYAVSEYGNSKGLEFTLMKRATIQDHFGFRLNYTLAQAVATSSSPGDNYMVPLDPYSNLPAFPLAEFPTAGDIRHRISNYIDFRWNNDQGPTIGGIYLIENSNINLTTTWRSGVPYTKTDLNGRAIGEIRTERSAPSWSTDMRINKQFPLKDWFGESMGNSILEFQLFVYNIFNMTSALGLYTSTNDADDPGLAFRRKLGDFSATPFYEEADFSNLNTYISTQYDNFGNRLYSKEADYDGNGVVDQDEKFRSYRDQLEQTTVQFQGNYQSPRSVFFNVFFRF